MRKLILLCLLGTVLTGCSNSMFHVHKVEVEQGNIMTPGMVNRLHPGMSEAAVKEIMGEPVLINIMNPKLKSYVYTSQMGSNPRTEKKLTLVFNYGILQSMQRSNI
jgi:outer membrane protein assembly factor BamE